MNSKIGGSTKFCFSDSESCLLHLKEAGYDFAELNLGLQTEPNKVFEDKLLFLRKIIPILSVHLPDINFTEEEVEKSKNFIEILSDQGTHLFVIHLFSPNLRTKDNFELKIKKLNEVADFARSKDSILALENTEEDLMTLKKVFDEIPKIDFCLDIGHAYLLGEEQHCISLIENFGALLKHIHMHDNVGGYSAKSDLHLPIGDGNINFTLIFEKLKGANYSGNITLELHNVDKESRRISMERARKLIFQY